MAGEQGFFRFFQSLQGLLAANGGEPRKKALQAVSGLDVVEQCTHQHPCASKCRRTGHNRGIANDDRLHDFIAGAKWPYRPLAGNPFYFFAAGAMMAVNRSGVAGSRVRCGYFSPPS